MKQKAVGFYWTMPVPWAGFQILSNDIDQAAEESRTIRYQRDAVRFFASLNGFDLIHEEVFLEISPDRSSEHVIGPLEQAASLCRRENATLLYVDFDRVQGRRPHHELKKWLQSANIPSESLFDWNVPGLDFEPDAHFREWRRLQQEWTKEKPNRIAQARQRALTLVSTKSYAEIAETLNKERLRSATGKPWTAEMVRKLTASKKEP